MARRKNVFTAGHEAFLEALADLGHFQLLIGWQISWTAPLFTLGKMGLRKIRTYVTTACPV
jgi:hypothetical protein